MTTEIEAKPVAKKRGRKPIFNVAQTPAKRKQEQRIRDLTAIAELDSDEWTESQCFIVLQSGSRFGKDAPQHKWAWQQLGKLRNFL